MIRNKFMILISSLLLVMIAGISARGDITFPDKNQMNLALRNVGTLILAGEFDKALTYLNHMSETFGDDPRITSLYEQVYKGAKLFPELEDLIRKEMAKDPASAELFADLAEAKYLQKDEHAADSLWNLALVKGGQNDNVYRLVAETKLHYGFYDDAIATYLRGRKSLGKPEAYSMELASIYEIQHDYAKAIDEYLTQSMGMSDKLTFVQVKIRGMLEDTVSADEIIGTINRRIAQSPGRPELYEILGEIYIKKGQMDKALECYRTIVTKQNDDGGALVRFASRCFDSRAYTTAISAADDYLKTTKKAAFRDLALLLKAKSQEKLGQADLALSNYKLLIQSSSDLRVKDEAGFSMGLLYSQDKGECDSALTVWGKMLGSSSSPAMENQARVEMAVCYLKKDQIPAAESLLAIVASSPSPDDNIERASFLLGDIAFYKGELAKAETTFSELIKKFPHGDFANDALMRYDVISMGGDDEASAKFMVKFGQAMKSQVTGDLLKAAQILSSNDMASSPIAEQAVFYAAISYSRAGSRPEAIVQFKKYIEKYPDGFYIDRAYLGLGDIYLQDVNSYPDAKAAFSKILESFPEGAVTEQARERLQHLESAGKIG